MVEREDKRVTTKNDEKVWLIYQAYLRIQQLLSAELKESKTIP
jgi:hypothetical protein